MLLRKQDYRKLAADCLQLAAVATSPKHRMFLVTMADEWHRLALCEERIRETDSATAS